MAGQQHVSCGRDLHCVPDISSSTQLASVAGFDFAAMPLVHPRFKREFLEGKAKDRQGAFARSDLFLSSQDWSSLVVGKLSPWLQLDSEDETTRKNSQAALKQELAYAAHLSVPAVLVPLTSNRCANLGRCLLSHMQGHSNHQVWIQVPMCAPSRLTDDLIENDTKQRSGGSNSSLDDSDIIPAGQDPWQWWNTLRRVCHHHKRLGVALEISTDLPPQSVINRWMGEPLKCAIFSTTLFLTNKKGYPVLSKAHQMVVNKLFRLDVQMMITGINRHPDKGIRAYQQYMDHLYQNQQPLTGVEAFAKGYEDYLQCPLQPLADNLESQTYEIFEKDPVKYTSYQKAVFQALKDRVPDSEKDTKTSVVMVLGAGRGPLVTASLKAAEQADRKIEVYAVEKNPNAAVTLFTLKEEKWGDNVTIVQSDMRDWSAPEKADIIVSELLGAFGDNELSPECLDGAQPFLKDDCISIPSAYTSHLSPIMSHKLYNEVRLCKDKDKNQDAHFETPYVVHLHNVTRLAPAVPLFTFTHPNKNSLDNTRYMSVSFTMEEEAEVHGFAGYFDTVLYKDIVLSTNPKTFSEGMFSWFSIFFPLKEPVHVTAKSDLVVHFWRNSTPRNVWYEWCVSEPVTMPIHNINGRSYTIGM
ncbi:protein arginine N-methyltransferase 5-like [Patiria miniata]|uniref:Protein arginine N-methyltransferase n=1 Tax=Patiria miniata TaxID=46514 RepID=A0A914B2P9_PATMI|nr:protein arginine N-methyltransferase 5-like [Patiria miniata]